MKYVGRKARKGSLFMYQNNIYIDNYEKLLSAEDKRMLGLHDWVGDTSKKILGR